MITVESAVTGRRVRYTSTSGETVEEGEIVSVTNDYVFVRYDKRIKPVEDRNAKLPSPHSRVPTDSPGVATDPANLEFV